MIPTKPFALFLLLVLGLAAAAHAQISTRMSTRFLAGGEQGLLEFSIAGERPDHPPVIPSIPQVGIRANGSGTYPRPSLSGRRLEHVFQYVVSSYTPGKYVIPSIDIIANGVRMKSEAVEFQVFDPNQLSWSEVELAGRPMRYAATFMTLRDRPYEGENILSEIKIYIPQDVAMTVQDWGVPEFERDGIASWRYEPSDMPGQLQYRAQRYYSRSYPSTMAATRTGRVEIGPATLRLTTVQMMMDRFGARNGFESVHLDVRKLALEALPLPPGAPSGFENAIGSFTLQAATSETEIREGEPVSLDLFVSGTGNLDTLRPPKPVDADGWKLYEPIASQRGDERRRLSGNISYRQILRPLELQAAIPSFRLVYFDPSDQEYKTISTEPIPIKMLPSANPGGALSGPPQALSMPVERMTDILAVIHPSRLTLPVSSGFPTWLIHLLGGAVSLALAARAFWLRFAPRFRKDPDLEARKRALADLDRMKNAPDTEFLKAAGNFIERWLGHRTDEELRAVLAQRDDLCFRADAASAAPLGNAGRSRITGFLRKAALSAAFIAALGFSLTPARAAGNDPDVSARALEAYHAAEYRTAIELWLGAGDYSTLSADVLYNIGNACYRLGSPGDAALYYRRALVRDPLHAEARQNLRFIERKFGSLAFGRSDFQYALARLPLPAWQAAVWSGAWLCVIGLLVFPATRAGARLRFAAVASLVAGPLLASTGALGWRYFPDDARFAPLERQAVIIPKGTVVHADAARTSPAVIDAPPGSVCEILRVSGRWAYVSFVTETRGWVLMENLEKILPDSPPSPPKLRALPTDGSNA